MLKGMLNGESLRIDCFLVPSVVIFLSLFSGAVVTSGGNVLSGEQRAFVRESVFGESENKESGNGLFSFFLMSVFCSESSYSFNFCSSFNLFPP